MTNITLQKKYTNLMFIVVIGFSVFLLILFPLRNKDKKIEENISQSDKFVAQVKNYSENAEASEQEVEDELDFKKINHKFCVDVKKLSENAIEKIDMYDTIYYHEPPDLELRSCNKIESKVNRASSKHIMIKDCSKDFLYKGYALITNQILNFPEVNFYGNTNSTVENGYPKNTNYDQIENKKGTVTSPYDPICAYLGKIQSNLAKTLQNEFAGKVHIYYSDGTKGTYAMDKLGNGISCMHMLAFYNTNIQYRIGEIRDSFPGFFRTELSKEEIQKIEEGERNIVDFTAIPSKLTQYISGIGDWISGLFQGDCDYKRNSDTTIYKDYLINEGIANYEETDEEFSCNEENRIIGDHINGIIGYDGPEITHINDLSDIHGNDKDNFHDADNLDGSLQVSKIIEIELDLENYCKTGSFEHRFFINGSPLDRNIHCHDCNQFPGSCIPCDINTEICEPKPYTNDLTDVKVDIDYKIAKPIQVGVPGALSALGLLYEDLQLKADALTHHLIAPQNGSIFTLKTKVYDPFGNDIADINGIRETDEITKLDNNFKEVYETEDIQFVLPIEYSAYFRAKNYNYGQKGEQFFPRSHPITKHIFNE